MSGEEDSVTEREDTVTHRDIAQRGSYTVKAVVDHMGHARLNHGLLGSVVFMGLPRNHGWSPFGAVKLKHQTYKKDVHEWLRDNPGAREVAVLSVDRGEWATVWVRHGHKPTADGRSLGTDSDGDDVPSIGGGES